MDIKPIRNTERGAVDTTGHSAQFSWLALLLLVIFIASRGAADSGLKEPPAACSGSDFGPTIVIGFVGGFVHRDNARHIEVQLAKRLSAECPGGVRAETFENRHSEQAHRAILRWLDADGDGKLSDVERGRARIILYGHSWGGAAVISLARELQGEGIPVLLTVQVDSIGKDGDDDRVVPANVARAINFFQTRRPLRGQRRIVAADATHTEILGNFRIDYKKEPKECAAYPWFDRHIFKWHTAIECDPRVWSQIEALIKVELFTPASQRSVAAASHLRK